MKVSETGLVGSLTWFTPNTDADGRILQFGLLQNDKLVFDHQF